ncbi:squalene synthase HpnC [Propionivibrio sp.]|uniref:squalene synthase HpnC n=1 Tax=Propionivibrio sp. TaxID=2212460 RepID=UPI0025D1618E|nr:squalene synthase HpnC [Propionivibrio sp.]MBK7356775.1 squalene synthase HpnC [Propionivibrio sp.]MBK8401817.1 squalene synthase HpnC [Propionivibrio sp.]MBK8744541.1 squalene synthase HpnC [Propionivibrio sp.]MBK8894953.1 squalene synthase HpnC [Propionivibrio sp.]MBL0208283.1 squalene synthase HpnC [Propionivibrio sp.]
MPVDHYENFPVASLLLPKRLRRPIEAIYRFARGADDIADEGNAGNAERLQALAEYRDELERIACGARPATPAFKELADVIAEWHLPLQLFHDLLDAFAQDVVKLRYADYAELLDYCRRSANPVGRLLVHLVDRASPENLRCSDCICTALQLINFWQDIAIDWQKGRVYLPQTDLLHFQIDEAQIDEQRWSSEWAGLLDLQIDRTQALMQEGIPLVRQLPGRMGWEIRLTIQGGLRILEKIRDVRGNVFRQRPVLSRADWLRMGSRALFM